MTINNKFNFLDNVVDITGYHGVVLGIATYTNGRTEYYIIAPRLDKDDKPMEGQWLDETRLKLNENFKKEAGFVK